MERNLLFFCVSRNGSYTILDRVETSEYVQVWGAFKWASASDFNTFLFKQVGKGHLLQQLTYFHLFAIDSCKRSSPNAESCGALSQ